MHKFSYSVSSETEELYTTLNQSEITEKFYPDERSFKLPRH